MTTQIDLTVRLWINPGQQETFRAFEDIAFARMRHYGAAILGIECPERFPNQDTPHEIHHIRFPSPQAFEAYRKDMDMSDLADMRARAIARTDIEICTTRPHSRP